MKAMYSSFFRLYLLQLGNNPPIDMLLPVIMLRNVDDHVVAQKKIRVVMGIGIQAKAEGSILQGAEHISL